MLILGIDPGTHTTGYGLIKTEAPFEHLAHGEIKIPSRQALASRLETLYRELTKLIETYRPDCVAVEDTFVAKNAKSSLRLGQARGIVLLAASKAKLETFEYSPREIKKAIVGTGSANKNQVLWMIRQLLKLKEISSLDAADALAIALCHAHQIKLQKRLAKSVE